MESIPEQLIKLRKDANVTQKEIAEVIGLTVGAICNYEKGRRPIRANDLEKIKEHCLKKGTSEGASVPGPGKTK